MQLRDENLIGSPFAFGSRAALSISHWYRITGSRASGSAMQSGIRMSSAEAADSNLLRPVHSLEGFLARRGPDYQLPQDLQLHQGRSVLHCLRVTEL